MCVGWGGEGEGGGGGGRRAEGGGRGREAGGGRHIEKRERQVMIYIVRENCSIFSLQVKFRMVFVAQRTDNTICLVMAFCGTQIRGNVHELHGTPKKVSHSLFAASTRFSTRRLQI